MKNVLWVGVLAVVSVPVDADTLSGTHLTEKNIQITQPIIDPIAPNASLKPVSDAPLKVATNGVAEIDLTTQTSRFFTDVRPPARKAAIPRTRWQHMLGHEVWTRAALSALKAHGKPLVDLVPADIENWCPAYAATTYTGRRAFWVGFMSALAKYESTYKPWAVGGGGRWYGLLQILPGTARGYKCNVGTGEALKNGAANLSCAVRIMSVTVPRDGVIYGRGGRGVAADWGPMRSASKRRDMARWLKGQNYCKPVNATRPQLRP